MRWVVVRLLDEVLGRLDWSTGEAAYDVVGGALAARMATDEGRQTYARRRAVGERPFAVIKQDFGARQFPLRGLDRVRQEWRWLLIAFNLKKPLPALQARAGPIPTV